MIPVNEDYEVTPLHPKTNPCSYSKLGLLAGVVVATLVAIPLILMPSKIQEPKK